MPQVTTKNSLEKVENGYIEEHAEKYGNKLKNIKSNPLKKIKKIEYKVEIENETQLRERITKLENKLTIKDDTKIKRWFFDTVINNGKKISQGSPEFLRVVLVDVRISLTSVKLIFSPLNH